MRELSLPHKIKPPSTNTDMPNKKKKAPESTIVHAEPTVHEFLVRPITNAEPEPEAPRVLFVPGMMPPQVNLWPESTEKRPCLVPLSEAAITALANEATKLYDEECRLEAAKKASNAAFKADIANGRSVAIFVCYDETRKRLCDAMGTTAGFYGGMRPDTRAEYIREFQANRIHCLISNIKAGGASVSLHDIHGQRPRTSYIFPTDNIVAFTQSTGRIHRAGGQSASLQFIPCLKGTLTEAMVSSMREKMLNLSAVHDGEWKGREQF